MEKDTFISNKYIFADDPLKQREHIKTAYAEVMANGGGIVIPKYTLEKYRGIYNLPTVKLASAIKEYYKKNLRGKSIEIEIMGGFIDVVLGTDGREKSVDGRLTPEKAATFEQLETLIKNGTYAYSQKNRNAENDKTYAKYVPQFHYFVNNVNINGIDIPVKIQIREMNLQGGTQYKYYTHNFVKNRGNASPGVADNTVDSHTRNVPPITTNNNI